MQLVALVSFTLLVGASCVVGMRLLALYGRTRGWPELLLGSMLVLVTGLGYPLRIAASQAGDAWAGPLEIVSDVFVSLGFVLLFLFTCHVFRPRAIWARIVVAIGVVTLVRRAFLTIADGAAMDPETMPLGEIAMQMVPMIGVYAWTACESLAYYAMMRKRLRLGLADPTVTNRFLLWGLMALLATTGIAVAAGSAALRVEMTNPALLTFTSLSGVGQAAFLVFTFVPPRTYLEWVRARAATATATV